MSLKFVMHGLHLAYLAWQGNLHGRDIMSCQQMTTDESSAGESAHCSASWGPHRSHLRDCKFLENVGLGGGGNAVGLEHRLAPSQEVGAGVPLCIERRVSKVVVLPPQRFSI